MKVTGTKKLLIILFALTCVFTLGLGALFGGWFFKSAPSAYAEEEKVTLPDGSAERLQKISEKTGIGVDLLTFYAKSNGRTESELCDVYDATGKEEFVSLITKFLSDYSTGALESSVDYSDEDWFISPDQAATYAITYAGNQDTLLAYYSSKSAVTTESQYFRNTGFTMGPYNKMVGLSDNSVNDRNDFAWYERMQYNFAWLEEGEEYYFGVNCNKSVTPWKGTVDTEKWMNSESKIMMSWANWCKTAGAIAQGYTFNNNASTETYINGWWFKNDPTAPDDGLAWNDPDPTRNNRTQWLDEFGSSINPSTVFMSNMKKMDGNSAATSSAAASSGQMGIWLSADAPSGTYFFALNRPNGGYWYQWNTGSYSSNSSPASRNNYDPPWSYGWEGWNTTTTFAVSICRTGITTPRLKFNAGVDSQLKNKEVDYDGTVQQLIIENDWGPGLITYKISEWDEATQAWVDFADNTSSTNVTCTSRPTAGSGKKGNSVFEAKNAGKYKVTMTPYRNWETENDKDPVEFTFTINPKKLETPTIFGDDSNTGHKFVNATGRMLFITLYPVSSEWAEYSVPTITNSLGTFNLTETTWDDNGVLTLGGMGQGLYTITVTIKDTQNVAWDTAVPPGSPPDTAPKVFTFEIGPMKITVPDIVGGGTSVSQFKKEVTYNGAQQTLSFMPINPTQLIINAVNIDTGEAMTDISTADKTLTINATDAGHYVVTVKVKPEYIFEEMSTELTYELIIHEAEVEAPYLCPEDAAVAVNNVKTVTYGGEKIAGTSQDWVATLTFDNADESVIRWVSKGSNISQTAWSDSRLTLTAKPAATYIVTFEPKKNYKWKEGVTVPDYTLVIEKLKIAKPVLFNDAEVTEEGVHATYTATSKSIGFDNKLHSIYLDFPTLPATSDISYTKQSSVYTLHEGNFETAWNGDRMSKTGREAGTFKITVSPTNNYCWSDGTSDPVIFTFIIVPVNVDCLDMYTTDEFGSDELMHITNENFSVNLDYDGNPKTVRIGNPDATNDSEKYLTTGDYAMTFYLLDKDGNFIGLLDGMTVDETGGFLTVTMTNAGVYRIGVSLNNTNYWWTESKSSLMIYTLTINAEGIIAPRIDESKSEGNNTEGNFGADIMRGTFAEVSDTHRFFMLVASFSDEKYSDFIKITAPDGTVYDYEDFASKKDSELATMRNEALENQYGVFTTWIKNEVRLYAMDQGEYTWTFEIMSDNYKWTTTEEKTVKLTILVKRSPVSGIEMRYVGDEDEQSINGDDGFRVGDENVRGDEYNSDKIKYSDAVFSEKKKAVRFIQSTVSDLYKAGFSTQFEYEIYKKAANGSYTEEITDPEEAAYTLDELKLLFLDAGEYEIRIRPKDNYCWNNDTTSTSRSFVVFRLVINTLEIEKPEIKYEAADGVQGNGVREVNYNHEFQLFQLLLKDYPNGYKISDDNGFYYINDDYDKRVAAGDEPIVRVTGVSFADGTTNLAVDADTSLLSVEARSAGEYHLKIVVSNINNYKFKSGDSTSYYTYRYVIKKLAVNIPDGYVSEVYYNSTNVDDMTLLPDEATVTANANNTGTLPLNYATQYKNNSGYSGKYYAVYLYGTDVKKGSFSIAAVANLTSGDASKAVQPDYLTDPSDPDSKLGYYRLCVREVSTYTITLNFVTADYYWGSDITTTYVPRKYEFTISKKQLEIPQVTDHKNTPLLDDTITIEKEFRKQHESISIENIPFGELLSQNPDLYSFVNLDYDNTLVNVDAFTVDTDGKATIVMRTLSPDQTKDYAKVTETYRLELKINSDNAEWKSGTKDGSKFYVIKITKARLERPVLEGSQTGDTKTVTYNADVWQNALKILHMDPATSNPLITYTLSNTDLMSADFTDSADLTSLFVSTKVGTTQGASGANVGTYKVVVKVADPDNYEWSTGDVADITFEFIIEPMKIAKPYIYLGTSTQAALGVVGLTRTVTYETDGTTATQYALEIGNYWHDTATGVNVTAPQYNVGVVPSVMQYTVANGTPDNDPLDYIEGTFNVDGTKKYGDMLYNEYNNGLLKLLATKAGKYVVKFELTDNAVWADGTDTDIEVILQIKKHAHKDPFIVTGLPGLKVEDRKASYTYEFSNNPVGAVEREMSIDNFNTASKYGTGTAQYDYMEYDASLTTGNTDGSNGYLSDAGASGTVYSFTATNAGTYTVTFRITDPDNHCWEFADVSTVTFTFEINKLALANPIVNSDYLLTTEKVSDTELNVDFDKREHTILVQSLFENIYDPADIYDVNNASGLGANFFTVENATDDVNGAGYSANHENQTDHYDSTAGKIVYDLFDKIQPIPNGYYTYNGEKMGDAVNLSNLFTLTAYTPGVYVLRFKLTDGDNMMWADGTVADIDYKLVINKVKHDAPSVASGTGTTVEYDGKDVYFTIQNVYNGVNELNGSVVATVSEEFEVTSYTGNDTSIVTPTGKNPVNYIESWYDGNLVLKMHSVGTYVVTVNITDTDYISWDGTADTSKTFTFVVAKRTLEPEVNFTSAKGDGDLNASLQNGAKWSISDSVKAEILLRGFRDVNGTVDYNAEFEVYYASVNDSTTKLGAVNITNADWIPTENNDGTYNAFFTFDNIAFGRGNIQKGNYTLNIVQTDTSGNYTLPVFSKTFTVEADPAPFKDEMLVWSYSMSTDAPGVTNPVGPFGAEESSALHIPFEDGVSYTFHIGVNNECLNGYDNDPNAPYSGTDVIGALNSWKVDWDGNYGGTRTANNAGEYTVTVTLTANDPDEWAFDTKTYTFYYVIDQALYDLSGIGWNYDGTTPFEFDDTDKSVALTGTLPADLTIDRYETSCAYVSDRFSGLGGPVSGTEAFANGNNRKYAGNYTTTVYFKVPANSNYKLPENPDINPDATYTDEGGSFVWMRTWEIKPQKIVVDWTQGGTHESDGITVTRDPSTVDGVHSSKFDYWKEKEDPQNPGTWLPATDFVRPVNGTATYRVTAYLKSTPSTPSTDYARNYVFEFVGKDNPCMMEVGGDDTDIVNHITVNGERKTDYEYTGDPVTAEVVIDFDTSNGAITESDISVLFALRATPTVTFSTAPSEIGEYMVILKLTYSGTEETYSLSEKTYDFNIVKAKFHPDDLEWHVKHTTDEGTVEAYYDIATSRWVNVDTREQVKIVYDGFAYEISLVSENTNLTFTMLDFSQIDANLIGDDGNLIKYVAKASAVFDDAHYEFAADEFANTLFGYDTTASSIVIEYEWEIEKQFLDLSKVNWDYEKPFEYTLVNGVPKAFKVGLKNLPDYLEDKIDFEVKRLDELITGDVTNEGSYTTKATIRTDDISANYTLGDWPASVSTTLSWMVNPKRLAVPQNDMSWSAFDGTQHNLLKPFGLDVDWAEYFDIAVIYEDAEGNTVAYDGTTLYGGKYYAYNAGTYSFTFKIKKDFNVTVNNKQMMNIVWTVGGNFGYDTDADQTVSVTIAKKELKVTGWFKDYENSYILTAGNIDATKFIEYEFYTGIAGSAGTKVSLDRVLESGGNESFSMVPSVRKAYQGNISLSFETGTEFTTFVTKEISTTDAQLVNGKPFIYGYSIDGRFTQYTSAELGAGDIFVTYGGKAVTFRIYDWDYYKNYVEVWNGDDLTQIEAGKYSLTLVLRKDLEHPLYWGTKPDGTIDRSSVTLTFEIRYNMLTVPELPEEVTYTGEEINVLSLAENATLKNLMEQYGEYVEITGNKATNVGEQTLYLKIKDEYGVAVRWDNGTENGLLGTYSFGWKILPVLLQRPDVDPDAKIVYDGEAHSVYEILVGYDKDNPSTAIANLMANVKENNARSVNAGGPFEATLSLPNENFSWCDKQGNKLDDRSPWTATWYIARQTIDFQDAYWGYMDGETPVAYDPDKPFVYTLENGVAKEFSVEILGLPDILKLYTTYTTNGVAGNKASAVNAGYITRVVFDLSKIDTKNYAIVSQSYDDLQELVWSIVPREFDLPEYDESWNEFDAKVHDLPELLGLGEDWSEYFDIKVEYKANEGALYEDYRGGDMLVVGYSVYKGFNYGYYRLTVTLKNNGSLMTPGVNIKWKDGASNPEPFEIIVDKYTVTIIGWNESDEYSEVYFEDYGTLPDEIADRFEYILYEDGKEDILLDREDIALSTGTLFNILYRFKEGTDANGIAYSYGIDLVLGDGVRNPYEFGTRDYGTQPIIWMPKPILETALLEYNGEQQTFVIKDFENLYRLSDAERLSLNYNHNLSIDASVKSFVYLQVANSLSVTAAGDYTAVVRLLGEVRLSWYDPALYKASPDHRTLFEADGFTPVSDPDSLYNNKSVILNFRVKKKAVPMLTDEDLEILKGMVVTFDGTEKDVVEEKADLFKVLEDKYGKIFEYTGTKGTAAGDYKLSITLKDPNSCIWYDGEPEKETVTDGKDYELTYVRDGDGWKVVFVKTGDNGPDIAADGTYLEYNDGDYYLDVKYMPEFEMEYFDVTAFLPDIVNPTTGENYYLYDENNNIVTIDGKPVIYDYVMDGSLIARYTYNSATGEYEADPAGNFVQRVKLDHKNGDKQYGYKIPVMEYVEEYTHIFQKLALDSFSEPIPALDKDGNTIAVYLYHNGGNNYELRQYQIGSDGKFVPNGTDYHYTVIEATCDMKDTSKSYNLIGGNFVEHPTNSGDYMIRFVLNDNGTKKQQIVYAKDENGNPVIDSEHTVITKDKYNVVTDKKFEVDWKIDSSILAMPEFDEDLMQQYTGKTLYAKDVLKGFLPDFMEIVEGGEGINAGTYTAKIVLTTENSKWNPEDTTENYVLVTWRIAKAKVDLSNIGWYYTDGTSKYTDSDSFVYTRKDDKPAVFWVGISNLPEVLKGRVVFNTNGKDGAYAGVSAGKYVTNVQFKTDDNFEPIEIPATFNLTTEWTIKRRMLSIPDASSVQLIFDNEQHDLLEMLGVPSDWNQYYDINVLYSDGGDYRPYEGYEGNPYIAYGFGSYKFTFSIKSGINTSITNPNVVWLKSSGDTEIPVKEKPETPSEAPSTPAEEATFSLPVRKQQKAVEIQEETELTEVKAEETATETETVTATETVAIETAATAAEKVIRQVCDRLKQLTYGAEINLQSFRKYSIRGTL